MLQAVINAITRADRSAGAAKLKLAVTPAVPQASDFDAALQQFANQRDDPDAYPAQEDLPVDIVPPSIERQAAPVAVEEAPKDPNRANLRASIRIGGSVVARVYNSGAYVVADGHEHLAVDIVGRFTRRTGPELADHVVTFFAMRLERSNFTIDWALTALNQRQWETQQAALAAKPAQPASFA